MYTYATCFIIASWIVFNIKTDNTILNKLKLTSTVLFKQVKCYSVLKNRHSKKSEISTEQKSIILSTLYVLFSYQTNQLD